ncbi:S-layer homology domain-containing protein [Cohnella phaseoli]|uniref:RHS repeat-associated protein n=1 Tax=Cohnella phaseoli TaxID=456490 RepID=A0A3D9I845_9BACL|nr:S-layer homology domain-containing protein [Cohnella phaseoli]RED57933.1 RHS repeat-associated protein [Cohnella phaseoli]
MKKLLARRGLSLLLLLSLLIQGALPFGVVQAGTGTGTGTGTGAGAEASDVGVSLQKPEERIPEWAKESIAEMTELGVIQGYEDGTFRAERSVTRAEITVMLLRFVKAASLELPTVQAPNFRDVGNEWFAKEVRQAANLGIVQGNEAGLFRPGAAVSRQESAVMLNRIVGKIATGAVSFKDKDLIPKWAQSAVAALVEAGVLQGYGDNTFQGQNGITRAEVAVILQRAKKLAGAGGNQAKAGPLSIKARQADGAELADAEVFVHEKGKRVYKAWGRTNAQGVWTTAAAIPYGNYDVHVVKEGFAGYQPVVHGEGQGDLEVTAQQSAWIEGTVLGTDGKPLIGAFLSFTTNPTFYAVTAADGTFRANVLPEKTYRLTLVEDASLSQILAKGGGSASIYGASGSAFPGLSLLDSEQTQTPGCECHKYEASQTFTSLGAGQTLKLGKVSIDGARPVTTSGGGGGGSSGNPVRVDTTPPAAPAGLSAASGNASVSLSWLANSENDLAGYKVYRSTDHGATWDAGTNVAGRSVTSYIVSGLTNGVTYRFALTAYDTSGNESEKSAGAEATPQAPPVETAPPAAPRGLTGVAGNTVVTLSWLANSETDLAGYEVLYSADAGATWMNGPQVGKVTEATVTGLVNGTAYRFTVRAFNTAGGFSERAEAITVTPKGSSGTPDPVKVATPISTTALPTFSSTVKFLYEGSEPLQTGVAAGAIEDSLVSVVRGKVLDAENQPLAGVQVSVLNQPELGSTKSREDGMFDLVVNGGGILTLQMTKEGYMPVQRKVSAVAEKYETLPDVVLKAYDTKVTVVDLDGATGVQAAQGSPVTDADGTRQSTVIFPEGSSATMELPDGSVVPLTEIHLRATEYTVGENGPEAMPGELPDYVGYTHAVELSADEAVQAGATEIRFNQPLFYYVENYLEFPVGEVVPMGYYDREAGRWVASENGRVVRILQIDGGIATVDMDGDGMADSAEKLAAAGFTDKERQQLAELYAAGQSLWRVPIEHFTPWDCNWPYGPPMDAEPPLDEDPRNEEDDDPCEQAGSIIGCQNQSLGQAIPIEGTGMNLNYVSTRTPGYKEKSKLTIPVSGDTIPDSLKSMSVTVEIGGKSYSKSFAPATNVTHTFQWDGLDAYERKLIGTHPYKVTVSFYYDFQYYEADEQTRSFGRVSGSNVVIGFSRASMRQPVSRVWYGNLESPNNPYEQAGVAGWSLDAHNILSMQANVLYEGDRNKKTASYKKLKKIELSGLGGYRIANTGIVPGPGNTFYFMAYGDVGSGNRDQVVIRMNNDGTFLKSEGFPQETYGDISADPQGNVYRYSPTDRKIYLKKFDETRWTVFAGTGNADHDIVDGAMAVESDLYVVYSIAAASGGSLYVVGYNRDARKNLFYRINAEGRIQMMGNTTQGVSGADSGKANPATIGEVTSVAMGADGFLYIHDRIYDNFNHMQYTSRVRKMSADGTITKIVGKTPDTYSNQVIAHGVAANKALFYMRKMFVDVEGNLWFIASKNTYEREKLYKVNKEGIVEEVDLDHLNAAAQTTLSLAAIDYNGNFIYSDGSSGSYRMSESHLQIAEFPEEDGLSVNAFDLQTGRILQNVSAFSGVVLRDFAYDPDGRLLSIADRSGNLTQIERDAQGNPTAIVAPGGQRTIVEVDAGGELVAITNPAGETYRMKYEEGGLLTEFTDPEQGVSQYAFDNTGMLVRAVNPEGGVKTLQRSVFDNGYSVTFTDPSNRITTYETVAANGKKIYTLTDPNGYQTVTERIGEQSETATLPDGTAMTKTFGTDPRMGKNTPFVAELTYTSPDGTVTKFKEERSAVTDNNGKLVSYKVQHTVNGDVSTIEYDRASHKFTETTAEGTKTETYLDEKDRIGKVAWPGTNLFPIETIYDSVGRLERVQQGERFIQYTYNAQNRVEQETDAFGSVKKYEYDAAGRMTSIVTPGNKVYGQDYDSLGNLTGLTMPDGAVYEQQFNPLGQFEGFAPSGAGLWYAADHDNGGSLMRTTLSSGRVIDHVLEPGDGKRPVGINDADIQRMFTYVGQSDYAQTIESVMQQDSSRRQKIEYGYSGESINTMALTGKANASFSYTYDDFFNMTNIAMTVAGAVYHTPIRYDNEDNLTQYGAFQFNRGGPLKAVDSIHDDKLDIQVDYDQYGKISSATYTLKGSQVYKAAYTYDKRGYVTDIAADSAEGRETTHFEYDLDGQLTGVTRVEPSGNVVTEAYGYDANKNRITSQTGGAAGPVVSSYAEHDVLTRVGDLAYSFDADGFLTQRGADTFAYGARGELLEATVANGTYKYTYDGLGRRVAKEDSAGRTYQYLYGSPDSLHLLTASVDPSGEPTIYSYNEMGVLIALERGGQRYYVVADGVGTPQRVLDDNGAVVKELRYDSFGNLQSDSNPAFELLLGYAGGLEDRDTGLIRFGFRDYDPAAGRWTARDPILVESGQANLYAYVNNNPVMFRDPCGQMCVGASVYAIVGIGGKVCITDEGVSACGDGGFGVGLGLEVTPFEDLAKNELTLEAMGKLTAGLGNLQAGYKLGYDFDTRCRTDGPMLRAEAGPFRIDLLKPKKSAVKGKESDFKKTIKELFKKSGLKAEASIKAKYCSNLRW